MITYCDGIAWKKGYPHTVFGYTEFDGETYLLAAKISSRKAAPEYVMSDEVADFLCYTRRPLARWLINVGSTVEVDADPSAILGLDCVSVYVFFG